MDESARKRAELIMKVNCGMMTATQAARELNVSRKTYYKWEKQGLTALLNNLTDRQAGRPQAVQDPRQKDLNLKLKKALKENKVLRLKMELKDILADLKPGINRAKKK